MWKTEASGLRCSTTQVLFIRRKRQRLRRRCKPWRGCQTRSGKVPPHKNCCGAFQAESFSRPAIMARKPASRTFSLVRLIVILASWIEYRSLIQVEV